MASQRKLQAVREGNELRTALSTAFASEAPQSFDNVLLNQLLDYAKLPRDHPKKDPLELKQTLAAVDPALGKLSLKQRKAMTVALENQLEQATRFDLPQYFFVEGGRQRSRSPSRRARRQGRWAGGRGVGDASQRRRRRLHLDAGRDRATIAIDAAGTQQQEIMMQFTPNLGRRTRSRARALRRCR